MVVVVVLLVLVVVLLVLVVVLLVLVVVLLLLQLLQFKRGPSAFLGGDIAVVAWTAPVWRRKCWAKGGVLLLLLLQMLKMLKMR
jgi:ABC-type Co2+ transport system permease subunit